jgi:glycerophosphoryl diester phosphodiesterase
MRRCALIAVAIAGCGDNDAILCPQAVPTGQLSPIAELPFVAHALGSPTGLLQGQHYSESRAAFDTSYPNGFRVYEVDLVTLGDGTIAAVHDEHEEEYGLDRGFAELTRAELEGRLWMGRYPVLFGEDIIDLMVDHPDIWMILDSKWDHEEVARRMVELAPDASVRDRLVPHVTSEAHAMALATIYPFPERMYARYQWDGTDPEVHQRMGEHGIDNVMMWWHWRWNAEIQSMMDASGYHVWVHTPEEPDKIEEFVANGIGVYTNGYITCTE